MSDRGSNEQRLLREDKDGIVTLTLNRPKQYNALTEELVADLQGVFDSLMEDNAARVVVIRANGKAFCTGHDLKQMSAHTDESYFREEFASSGRMMVAMTKIPQPVIARIHGIATAGGCQLVANCDLAVASEDASFATNGIANGLFCSTPSVPISRNLNRKQAFEMLFTGEFIDAPTALAWGLVNRVVPADRLDTAVAELADSIKSKSRVTVASGKRMFYEQLNMPLLEAYRFAGDVMAKDMMSEDAAEGINAFVEKRKPVWRDR
ncbi:MAG: enoyl-CoA hydratase [Alphaproteobacteria bacterium]|nr:enoyl-CoA hydratase [Alphaproteobacteria bacterium]